MSIVKRLVKVIISAVVMFITLAVMYKLFMENENWLHDATVWTFSWMAANFIAKILWEFESESKIILLINIGIIVFVFIILSFIFGVVLSYSDWKIVVTEVMIPFGMSLVVHSMNS